MKVCNRTDCYFKGREQPLISFYKNKSKPDGLNQICKSCHLKYCANNYQKNREQKLKYAIEYQRTNKDRIKQRSANWYQANKHVVKKQQNAWRKNNPEKKAISCAKYYRKNKEYIIEQYTKYRKLNPEKIKESYKKYHKNHHYVNASNCAKYRASKLQRTPAWANFDKIKEFYKQAQELTGSTGIKHAVDHIIPLQGNIVSGLHIETNLQVITQSKNASKGNKFDTILFTN